MPKIVDEEEPFRKIRLTLSEDAIEKLGILRKRGYFRSDSMTVEESIRTIYAVLTDIDSVLTSSFKSLEQKDHFDFSDEEIKLLLELIIARLDRFTKYTIRLPSKTKK